MKIFVISLKDSKDRRKEIIRQMKKFELDFEFFDAVDGRCGLLAKYENLVDRKLAKQKLYMDLVDAEIACALSHSFLYKKIIQDKIQHSIILEDDVILSNDFADIVKNKILENSEYNFIMLYHNHAKRLPFSKGKQLYNDFKVYKSITKTTGAVAYYIDIAMAKKLYKATQPISYVADWPINVKKDAVFVSPCPTQHPPIEIKQSDIWSSNSDKIEKKSVKLPRYITGILIISEIPFLTIVFLIKKLFNINLLGKNTDKKIVRLLWGLKPVMGLFLVDISNKN